MSLIFIRGLYVLGFNLSVLHIILVGAFRAWGRESICDREKKLFPLVDQRQALFPTFISYKEKSCACIKKKEYGPRGKGGGRGGG